MHSKSESAAAEAGPPGSNARPRIADVESKGQTVRADQLQRLLETQAYRCALTGRVLTPETASLSHRRPLCRGGEHAIDNIQIVHVDANAAKGAMLQEDFIRLCREVAAHADRLPTP